MNLHVDKITTCTELSEAQEIEHAQMMAVSDYYCRDCQEYFMLENMTLEREPHGEYIVLCPHCGSSEIES